MKLRHAIEAAIVITAVVAVGYSTATLVSSIVQLDRAIKSVNGEEYKDTIKEIDAAINLRKDL